MSIYENREYMIIHLSEIQKVDFTQILEDSVNQLRKSVDKIKTIVKWEVIQEGYIPSSIKNLDYKDGPFTHSEILDILNTDEWVDNTPIEN